MAVNTIHWQSHAKWLETRLALLNKLQRKYNADEEALIAMLEESRQKLDEIADQYDRILFLGDGIDTCGELIRQWDETRQQVIYAPEEIRYQDAAAVALRGLQLWNDGKACDYIELQPEYLRMAEAEKKLKERKS